MEADCFYALVVLSSLLPISIAFDMLLSSSRLCLASVLSENDMVPRCPCMLACCLRY